MFSELFDNEWTAAYTFMEEKFEPEQIESFLLDIAMDSYTFCNEKAHSSWSFVTKWFLPESDYNAQTVRRVLKDGQKRQAQGLVSQLEMEFFDHITAKCSVEQLRRALSNKELAGYIHLCVKVCFLMAVNDPPVIIECPNRGKPDIEFNRAEFKEYKTRGPYMAFYVWPLIRLAADGPLLSKGVAQGANEPANPVAWTWSLFTKLLIMACVDIGGDIIDRTDVTIDSDIIYNADMTISCDVIVTICCCIVNMHVPRPSYHWVTRLCALAGVVMGAAERGVTLNVNTLVAARVLKVFEDEASLVC
ncbi:hypothetical protein MAR_023593 [Mya arenaria]|uniref:Mitochondria-eating protein C-terminal domain-containing protein n=1 Tax=Mya arenaria TaxID=6604 RepID=A0ABY7DS97_MYAAR|nr:hypothetical protein MAR_023593 [Mya arenaria]